MNPKITAQMMRQLQLAPSLADLLERVWGSQNRFLEFDSVVHHDTLASHCSMPQGDPLSPFCLALWASAGLRHVDAAATNTAPALTLCYMDDRSMWSSSLDAIIERVNIWSAWSDFLKVKTKPKLSLSMSGIVFPFKTYIPIGVKMKLLFWVCPLPPNDGI